VRNRPGGPLRLVRIGATLLPASTMSALKHRLALVFAIAAAAFAAGATAPTTPLALTPTAAAKACSASYKHAVLPTGHKCLRAGQFCAIRFERFYHRAGYHCHAPSRDDRGNYHLTR
jgi:hypothetical protein